MKLVIFILLCCLWGCDHITKQSTQYTTDVVINGKPIYIYVIDGCEYYGSITGANNDLLCHKGNCNNPIHHQNH